MNFQNQRVQIIQVGLGTNSTFIQNLLGDRNVWCPNVAWLMESLSEARPNFIKGIGVEPVAEHAKAMQKLAKKGLHQVSVVQVALGKQDEEDVAMHVLTQRKQDKLMQQVNGEYSQGLERSLVFLRNMTCVGDVHPEFEGQQAWLRDCYGVEVDLEELRTEVWSYQHLSWAMNFRGCELLIVDAEGHDAMILRSMIDYCSWEQRRGHDLWPYVIQFETMGHCDRLEGRGTEWSVISDLERIGYTLICYSHYNSQLVYNKALKNEPRIYNWTTQLTCRSCRRQWNFPYVYNYCTTEGLWLQCKQCLFQQ